MNLSIEILGVLLPALFAGGLLGAAGAIIWTRKKAKKKDPSSKESTKGQAATEKQEAQRFFLLNETGNVLISTSLSPTGRLPESTLALFSEALAHMAAVFFAVAGTNDPTTEKPFTLYNYWALKRALERHPAFIRVSTENAEQPALTGEPGIKGIWMASAFATEEGKSPAPEQADDHDWLERRVKKSREALRIDDNPENVDKLRAIHSQLRTEAKQLGARKLKMSKVMAASAETMPFRSVEEEVKEPAWTDLDKMEIGHITLYCECLMGVSIVTVKLAHARYDEYLKSDKMEQDTYLFVSTSQLKQTMSDVNNIPQMNIYQVPVGQGQKSP